MTNPTESRIPRCSSAGLHGDNRVLVHPVCHHVQEGYFTVNEGWELVGYCDAPFKNAIGQGRAIVYRKNSPASDDYHDTHHYFEPGLYWGHDSTERMRFV